MGLFERFVMTVHVQCCYGYKQTVKLQTYKQHNKHKLYLNRYLAISQGEVTGTKEYVRKILLLVK